MERTAFKEAASIKDFSVITEDEALVKLEEMVSGLLAGTRPLSDNQYQLVKEFITDRDFTPYSIASKNTAVKLLLDTRDLKLAGGLYMSDVIRLTDEMNFLLYGNEDMTKLNLKNQDRRFITALINELFRAGRVDLRSCYEKKKLWKEALKVIPHGREQKPRDISWATAFMASDYAREITGQCLCIDGGQTSGR